MKTIAFLLITFVAAALTSAQEVSKIEGAFGMTLGAEFDPASAIAESKLNDGTPIYQFTPESPFRSLTKYYVLITPKTHMIYGIWGVGSFENMSLAGKEQDVVIELLTKKYGPLKDTDSFYEIEIIEQGERQIVTKVSGMMSGQLEIRYEDTTLEELAEKERIEIEASKVDASGL